MQKVTIKTYAVSHKLSIFNVMKMVKSGELLSESVEESGKEIIYILLDEAIEEKIKSKIVPLNDKEDAQLRLEVIALKKELKLMKEEINTIKKMIKEKI